LIEVIILNKLINIKIGQGKSNQIKTKAYKKKKKKKEKKEKKKKKKKKD